MSTPQTQVAEIARDSHTESPLTQEEFDEYTIQLRAYYDKRFGDLEQKLKAITQGE